MRDYGKVSPKFWIGQTGKALRKHGLETQLVGLYLLTSPHSNMLGLYTLPVVYIAHETGLGLEGAYKGLHGCIEAAFCRYDEDTEMVWVIEMAHYQIAGKLNVRDKQCLGVQKAYNELIENPFLSGFYEKYAVDFNLTQKRGGSGPTKPPSKALSKPLASQEQEQEQEQEQKPRPSSSSGDDGAAPKAKPFDQFWDAYPHKVAKIEAQKAWAALKLDSKVDVIVAAVVAQKDGDQFRRDGGQYIPHPATWLRAGRWLDEVRPYVAPAPKMPAGWWETKAGAEKAGAMLASPLTPRPGEFLKDFVQRIREAMGEVDPGPYVPLEPARKIERPYIPPAPPEGVQLTPEQLEARRLELREAMKSMNEKASNARAGVTTLTEMAAA